MNLPRREVPVFVLCGGLGTRFREETEARPKPMVTIGNRPILWHIMRKYSQHGFRRFVLCLGYKAEIIKSYFLNYASMNSDFTVELMTNNATVHSIDHDQDWTVTLAYTGELTMTGARVAKAARKYLGDAPHFAVTYGDGLAEPLRDGAFDLIHAQDCLSANAALELLPESLASMAILQLQMRLVYKIGQAYGYELDQAHMRALRLRHVIGGLAADQHVALYAIEIIKADGEEHGQRRPVDRVHEPVQAVEALAFENTAKQCFRGRSRARGIDTEAVIKSPGGFEPFDVSGQEPGMCAPQRGGQRLHLVPERVLDRGAKTREPRHSHENAVMNLEIEADDHATMALRSGCGVSRDKGG